MLFISIAIFDSVLDKLDKNTQMLGKTIRF